MRLQCPSITPLWYQLPSWKAVDNGIRRKISSYPRRHGKDFEDLSIFSREAVRERGSYFYVFPTRRWGERAVWETMATIEVEGKKQTKPIIEWMFPKEYCKLVPSDLRVEITGSKGKSFFFMGGSDNLDFVGQGGQGYGMSEFSLHKKEVTGLLAPIIRQSQALLFLNGTMRGKKNPLYQILDNTKNDPEWFSTWLKPEQTKLYCWLNEAEGINVNPELKGLINQINPETGAFYKNCQGVPYYDIQSDVDSGLISFSMACQEYLNRADTEVYGGYYGYELKKLTSEGRKKPIDPHSDLVYTFWDLGGSSEDSDKTCITFAHFNKASGRARVVDYYENRGHLRGHYVQILEEKGYNYGGHFIPHDGKRSNAWTGEGFEETARSEFGLEARYIPKSNSIANDIEVTRRGFANTEFDSERCEDLIDSLTVYHEKEATGKPCHQENCRDCHGASHAADSFRYMQMAIKLGLVVPYLEGKKEVSWRDEKDEEDWFII